LIDAYLSCGFGRSYRKQRAGLAGAARRKRCAAFADLAPGGKDLLAGGATDEAVAALLASKDGQLGPRRPG